MTENASTSAEPSSPALPDAEHPAHTPPITAGQEHPDHGSTVVTSTVRRRWPWWAWALLIGIPVMIVSGIANTLIANVVLDRALQTVICYADGYCGVDNDASSGSGEDPSGEVSATNHVPIDGSAIFEGNPVWALTLDPTWQPLNLDLVGLAAYRDDATGCELIASQSFAAPNAEDAGDAVLSADLLSQELDALTAGNSEALVINAGAATSIPVVAAESGSTIDFLSATISQRNADDVAMSTEIVARSMPNSGGALVAMLTCETATIPTFGEKFDFFSTALAVTVGP
ncbi:hypothetical protein [Salinibacterium sp. SWN1162]|uniref:hypothetical protein n=1 Tax=Salinibacterium sp. SWN1162 TaxID=2792053 RepID=UPI0018CE4816|nr:hypothetical protein [Salinibacterium sp. SWN1162]MBH0008412.1 hypothetical protein [Salinibacterium sp. SWN1162]